MRSTVIKIGLDIVDSISKNTLSGGTSGLRLPARC